MSEHTDDPYRAPTVPQALPPTPVEPGEALAVSQGGATAVAVLSFLIVVVLFFFGQLLQLLNIPFGLMATSLFIFGAAGLAFPAMFNLKPGAFTGLSRPPGAFPLLAILIGVANLPFANFMMGACRELLPKSFSESGDELTKLLINADHPARVLLVIAAGLAAPLGEETFFRGWLLGVLSQAYRRSTALIAVAVVFSIVHWEWDGFVARVELGVLFGLARIWTGSLWPAVAMHATHNIVSTVVLYVQKDPLKDLDAPFDWKAEVPTAAVSLIVTLLLLRVFYGVTRGSEGPEPCLVPAEQRVPLRLNMRRFVRLAVPDGALLAVISILLGVFADSLPGSALTRDIRRSLFGTSRLSAPSDVSHPQEGSGHLK